MQSNPQNEPQAAQPMAARLLPLAPIGVAVFLLSALIYYHLRHDVLEVRSSLQSLVAWIYLSFGFAPSCLFGLLLLTWGSIWFVMGSCSRVGVRMLRLVAATVMLGLFLNLGTDQNGELGVSAALHKGTLGAWLAGGLVGAFGYLFSLVLVWIGTVAALLLATDFFFREEFDRLRAQALPSPLARDDEQGVEASVAAAFHSLADAATADAVPEPAAAAATELAPHDDEVEFEPDVEAPTEPARASYFERRYHRSEADEPDDSPQQAPEAQEFTNAEAEIEADLPAPDAEVEEFVLEAFAEDDKQEDAAEPAPALEQRSLFAEPPAAPRAPVGEWFATYGEEAAAPAEPIVPIPRQAAPARTSRLPEALVEDAAEEVRKAGRATTALLQRRLRVDFETAQSLLQELVARGIVATGADAPQG